MPNKLLIIIRNPDDIEIRTNVRNFEVNEIALSDLDNNMCPYCYTLTVPLETERISTEKWCPHCEYDWELTESEDLIERFLVQGEGESLSRRRRDVDISSI
jgi:hypothetical protein